MSEKWLEWAKELQAMAQAGLTYANNVYDLERYQELRKISLEIMAKYTETNMNVIKDLFANETGYPTPKVDIRAVILQDDNILLVREKMDGKWALPGGWADIGYTPKEIAVKEVKEESGLDVKPIRLLMVHDKKCHPHPPSPYHVYKMFILCEIDGGAAKGGTETSAVEFFPINDLPPLSIERNTESQIQTAYYLAKNPQEQVICD